MRSSDPESFSIDAALKGEKYSMSELRKPRPSRLRGPAPIISIHYRPKDVNDDHLRVRNRVGS